VGLLERDFRQRPGSVTSPREGQTASESLSAASAAVAAATTNAPGGAVRAEYLRQRAGTRDRRDRLRRGSRDGGTTLQHDDPGWFLLFVFGGDGGCRGRRRESSYLHRRRR